MTHRLSTISAALALALAGAAATSANAQSKQAELHIDLASHSMPGMPGLGALSRLSGTMGGAGPEFGMAAQPAMPGRYMDVSLLNRAAPGRAAQQAVPKGLQLGKSIDLLPRTQQDPRDGSASYSGGDGGDGSFKVRYYWGCGEQARSGQPANFTMTVRNGKPVHTGRVMAPRKVPGSGSVTSQHVLWPNPSNRRSVSGRSSLVGAHQISGDGLSQTAFTLGAEHDFLPELKLSGSGGGNQGMTLRWSGAEGARGYFIHAVVTNGDSMVMWSSSEDGYAGPELLTYLPESLVGQWVQKRTLLRPGTQECRIPKEVFAAGGTPMVQMIAYGNDRSLTQSGLRVRVRSKSTAMLMPGMGTQDAAQEGGKSGARGLLRGLIGR
ncbi:hypothetical protein [Luteimonas sp. e5]